MILSLADDSCTDKYVDKHLGFRTHKTHTPPIYIDVQGVELNIEKLQKKLYVESLMPNSIFRYEPSNRFPNEKGYGVRVVANILINKKQELKSLAGQCFDIANQDVRKGVNDFSLLWSERTKHQMMFLGPVAYVNHDCESNCTWSSLVSKSYVNLRSLQTIQPGEEITAYYGDHFFGENNAYCRCVSCEMANKGVFEMKMLKSVKSQVTQVENMDDDQVRIDENQTSISNTVNDVENEVHDALEEELSSSDNYYTSDSESSTDVTTDEDNVLKYECEKCQIVFRFKSWFNRHLSTHDPASFRCNYCPKVFKRKDTLGEHMSRHVGGRIFRCNICVKKFSDRRNLSAHLKSIHNSDPVKCPKCQNMYADKRQLRYHNLRMHTNNKPFHCECNASFAVPSMLSKHRTKMNHLRPK